MSACDASIDRLEGIGHIWQLDSAFWEYMQSHLARISYVNSILHIDLHSPDCWPPSGVPYGAIAKRYNLIFYRSRITSPAKVSTLYSLTYDLWNIIVDEAVDAYSPLLDEMQRTLNGISLSKNLVDKLKLEGTMDIVNGARHFLLAIELYDDGIGGFKISLFIAESLDAFEEIKDRAASAHDVTFEDIRNFEVEHGMNMAEEIMDGIEERYSVYAEEAGVDIVFELVVFDSEDIDSNNLIGNGAWEVNS
jgi:hypothetical protein